MEWKPKQPHSVQLHSIGIGVYVASAVQPWLSIAVCVWSLFVAGVGCGFLLKKEQKRSMHRTQLMAAMETANST